MYSIQWRVTDSNFFLWNNRSNYLCSLLAIELKFNVETLLETVQYFAFIYIGVVNEMDISQFTDPLTDFLNHGCILLFLGMFKVNFQIIYPKLLYLFLSCVVWWWLKHISVEILNNESLTYFHWELWII